MISVFELLIFRNLGLCLFIIPRSMTYKESTIEKDYKRAHIAESGKMICRAEDAEMTKVTRDMRN